MGQLLPGLNYRPPYLVVLSGVPVQGGGQGVQQGAVPLQQPQRRPAGGQPPFQPPSQQRRQGGHGKLHRRRIAHRQGLRRLFQHRFHLVQQLVQPLSPSGAGPHRRHPQPAGQLLQIHPDPLALRLIQQVDAHHRAGLELQHLEDQVQVALQAGGVAYHHRSVRSAEAEKVPGHLLFRRMGHQRISTGQVHQHIVHPPVPAPPPGSSHRLARPVSRVLMQACQGIEHGGFAHVGIACQGNHPFPV